MIKIDGSSGGGSVLRIGIGLSVATGIPVKITNIRKARSDPGLKHQHLAGLLATAKLCEADLKGAKLGSKEIEFHPHEITQRGLSIEIPTAGSIGLFLQPLQIACLKAEKPVEVEIQGGGTYGKWAPPIPYLKEVNFAILKRFGQRIEIKVKREGFYPKGGAQAQVKFYPPQIKGPVALEERGKLLKISGLAIASHHLRGAKVAERQAEGALEILKAKSDKIAIDITYADTLSPGAATVLWATFENTIIGSSSLGERGKRAEDVGREAAFSLIKELKGKSTLDHHMADQIIPYLGLCGGSFLYGEMTEHMRINIAVVERFGGKFDITKDKITTTSAIWP
jgi:RNA 3'-terminal phosphate cyclase (ATP)/RNA 3'-terminal phosphate cyclase (GTP)